MSEKASYFNEREHQICLVGRMVEDARTYWVAGGVSSQAEMLDKLVGANRLKDIQGRATIKEGYAA